MQLLFLFASNVLGLFFAYVDSRPNWDDAGVLAGVILVLTAILGASGPRKPWLWALGVGIWMPLNELLTTHRPPASALALVFAFAGAYLGAGLRRLAAQPT
jgi:hypothetical protein